MEPTPKSPKSKNVWKTLFIILLVLIVLGGLGSGAWYYYRKLKNSENEINKLKNQLTLPSPTSSSTPTAASSPKCAALSEADKANVADWKTYTNDTYKFSFKYPAAWQGPDPSRLTPDETVSLTEDINPDKLYVANFVFFGPGKADKNPIVDSDVASKKTLKIDCDEATQRIYNDEPIQDVDGNPVTQKFANTTLTHNGNLMQFRFIYPSAGEAADSERLATYNLVLKTIKFQD